MQLDEKDAGYLWDMLDAAKTALEFAAGYDAERYLRDRKLQLAVERLVEIIGEAARSVSSDFREAHPEIPWRRIIAQRHVLTHEYGEIRQGNMWVLICDYLPQLTKQLDALLPPHPAKD
ncbi:MAG TPA: HepT-like ribonuclease domain-containing protein [Armatimonadota bacterium]|nr:HepT-like ribonuclease domain-containing protein [Armatimonadota bacterium]